MLSILSKTNDQWVPCVPGARIDATTMETDNSVEARNTFVTGRLLRYKDASAVKYEYGQVLSFDNTTGRYKVIGSEIPEGVNDMQYYVVLRGIVPDGGTEGQLLAKSGSSYGDAVWTDKFNMWSNSIPTDSFTTNNDNLLTCATAPQNANIFRTGAPIYFEVSGNGYYGKIMSIDLTTGFVVKYMGPTVSGTVTNIIVGKSNQLAQWEINFSGEWAETATTTLIETNRKSYSSWGGPHAYVVGMQIRCVEAYTSGGVINAIVNGQELFTDPKAPVVGQWVTLEKPNPAYYDIATDGPLEISTTAGTGGPGKELSVSIWLVNEMGQ